MINQDELSEFMDVELVLGNPKIECDGYGICKFIQKGDSPNSACKNINQFVKAILSYEDFMLIIIFNRLSISIDIYLKHFGRGYFLFDVDTELPHEIAAFFSIDPSVLLKGRYQIEEKGDDLKVIVQIETNNSMSNNMQRLAAL